MDQVRLRKKSTLDSKIGPPSGCLRDSKGRIFSSSRSRRTPSFLRRDTADFPKKAGSLFLVPLDLLLPLRGSCNPSWVRKILPPERKDGAKGFKGILASFWGFFWPCSSLLVWGKFAVGRRGLFRCFWVGAWLLWRVSR